MTNPVFYHYDRICLLKEVIGFKRIFRNNDGKPNGFFINLLFSPEATDDFGYQLKTKVDDFIYDTDKRFDFLDELIARFIENQNPIVRKVIFELIFEETRRNSFKDLPSRSKSLFVVESLESIEVWKQSLLGEGTTYKLTTNKLDAIHKADSTWLESCSIEDLEGIKNASEKYWAGIESIQPKNEWLIIGEFNCEILQKNFE